LIVGGKRGRETIGRECARSLFYFNARGTRGLIRDEIDNNPALNVLPLIPAILTRACTRRDPGMPRTLFNADNRRRRKTATATAIGDRKARKQCSMAKGKLRLPPSPPPPPHPHPREGEQPLVRIIRAAPTERGGRRGDVVRDVLPSAFYLSTCRVGKKRRDSCDSCVMQRCTLHSAASADFTWKMAASSSTHAAHLTPARNLQRRRVDITSVRSQRDPDIRPREIDEIEKGMFDRNSFRGLMN